ncbi:hypothetical protein [Brumicola blandensis]|uniref:Uncharacterized protein n=1 Tax=Brumicola blandensis TaxID=3075611 RepID=A0AAW8R4M9_9ALTE|nr:hypothetical protein [Alteromonas sp. W409]MDT0584358.1 hypothetical protein [Alteromonas sp. W409]
MKSEPQFESYTQDELYEILHSIDKDAYPERYKKVVSILGLTNEIFGDDAETLDDDSSIEVDPELAEINKTKRINDFFDSLSDYDSEYLSDGSGGGDFDGGGFGGGADGGSE